MTHVAPVVMHLRDLERDAIEALQGVIERRCEQLAREFHEVGRFEVHVFGQGNGFEAHGHVSGRRTDFGTHARADVARVAAELALDKLEQQLRRAHDKRIFQQRREAQRHPTKREIGQ
jgi:ribosomal subunit interface protein